MTAKQWQQPGPFTLQAEWDINKNSHTDSDEALAGTSSLHYQPHYVVCQYNLL